MKKLLYIVMLMCGLSLNAQTWPPAGMEGSGVADDPWQIKTPEQLHALALFVNASKENSNATLDVYYRLMNDINLFDYLRRPGASPQGWLPIGRGLDIFGNERYAFQGHFHGGGHDITGLWIRRIPSGNNDINTYFNGLFGVIENATIDSLGVQVSRSDSIVGANFTGILVGQAYWNSKITETYVKGKVVGQNHTGGMVGFLSGSHILNCYAVVNVYGSSQYTGGLVGHMYWGSTIEYAYSTGHVESHAGLGGLVGYVRHESSNIRNVVADQAQLIGNGKVGALVGERFDINPTTLNIFRGYVNSTVRKPHGTTGHDHGIDRNKADFISIPASSPPSQPFYTNAANWTGGAWDFNRVWIMPPNGHPVFKWQDLRKEIIEAIVFVDDIEIPNSGNNRYFAEIACGEDSVTVRIVVGLGEFVYISSPNIQSSTTTFNNTYRWGLPRYSANELPFRIKSTGGEEVNGRIIINKPIHFDTVTRVYWNNTLAVINNPDNNGGFEFTSFKWFEGNNTHPFSTHQWFSVDPEGHRELTGTRQYRLELTAKGYDSIIHTCHSDFISLSPINFTVHPNPVFQGGTILVENDLDASVLKSAVINIYNVNGQRVDTFPAMQQNYIDFKYAKGTYILVLEGKDGLRKETKIIVL